MAVHKVMILASNMATIVVHMHTLHNPQVDYSQCSHTLCVEREHLWVQWCVLAVTTGLAHLPHQECTATERCVG